MNLPINRTEAIELLKSTNPETSDMNHYLESEAILKAIGKELGEDENYYAMLGLLHDVDWSLTKKNPSEHISLAPKILKEKGFSEEFINTIITHVYGFEEIPKYLNEKRTKPIEHALSAGETLTGIIHAYALMRDKNISTMQTKGLKKKFKDKKFAENCNRDIIKEIEEVNISLERLFEISIEAIKEIKGDVGLN